MVLTPQEAENTPGGRKYCCRCQVFAGSLVKVLTGSVNVPHFVSFLSLNKGPQEKKKEKNLEKCGCMCVQAQKYKHTRCKKRPTQISFHFQLSLSCRIICIKLHKYSKNCTSNMVTISEVTTFYLFVDEGSIKTGF